MNLPSGCARCRGAAHVMSTMGHGAERCDCERGRVLKEMERSGSSKPEKPGTSKPVRRWAKRRPEAVRAAAKDDDEPLFTEEQP